MRILMFFVIVAVAHVVLLFGLYGAKQSLQAARARQQEAAAKEEDAKKQAAAEEQKIQHGGTAEVVGDEEKYPDKVPGTEKPTEQKDPTKPSPENFEGFEGEKKKPAEQPKLDDFDDPLAPDSF